MSNKPTLNTLRDDLVLNHSFRGKVRIPDGILCGEVKNWKDCWNLVDGFFKNCESAFTYSYEEFIKENLESLQRIIDEEHEDDKELRLLAEFAERVKKHILHPTVLEETQEAENLDHEGRMTALLVAQNQSKVIQESERKKNKQTIRHTLQQSCSRESSSSNIRKRKEDNEIQSASFKKKKEIETCQNGFSKLHFELPEESKRYKIRGFDVSRSFYEFQMSLKNRTERFYAETHVHHILSLLSILLVKPGRMNQEQFDVFGSDNVNSIIQDMKDVSKVEEAPLPMDLITTIIRIIEKLKAKEMTRSEAVVELLKMEKNLNKNNFKVIKSVASMLVKLPKKTIMESVKGNELCTRYLDPLLCGLFDEPESEVFFRTNERTNTDKDSDASLSNNRPDAVISVLEGVKWTINKGFGEAKCSGEANRNYLTSVDLIRLGMFSKTSIECHGMKGVLSLQAIGNSIIFYITTQIRNHMNVLFEIAEIIVPRSLGDILKYLMGFGKLLCTLDLFERWCVEQPCPSKESYLNSPNMANIYALISPTSNRGRQCITKQHY